MKRVVPLQEQEHALYLPFVMRLMESLVEEPVMKTSVYPVDEAISEKNKGDD